MSAYSVVIHDATEAEIDRRVYEDSLNGSPEFGSLHIGGVHVYADRSPEGAALMRAIASQARALAEWADPEPEPTADDETPVEMQAVA